MEIQRREISGRETPEGFATLFVPSKADWQRGDVTIARVSAPTGVDLAKAMHAMMNANSIVEVSGFEIDADATEVERWVAYLRIAPLRTRVLLKGEIECETGDDGKYVAMFTDLVMGVGRTRKAA